MATITIDIPDELSVQLELVRERIPELLALSLQQPAVPAHIYRALVNFLARKPTSAEIVAYRPTSAMQERLAILLERSHAQHLTTTEQAELDEFERIEHLVIMLKTGSLPYLVGRP